MLVIDIEEAEHYDESTSTFVKISAQTYVMEHSLVSVSKWEAKWQTPFLSEKDKTEEQAIDYLRCMLVDPLSDPTSLTHIGSDDIERIQEYINSPRTATTFAGLNRGQRGPKEVITSELVYFWMTQLQIPFESESWHLNRLFALIQIASVKTGPKKKMSGREVAQQNADLNAERRAKMGSLG